MKTPATRESTSRQVKSWGNPYLEGLLGISSYENRQDETDKTSAQHIEKELT